MSHGRQQIRDALATLLTGLATTGSNVFVAPSAPIPAGIPYSIEIHDPSEEPLPEGRNLDTISRRKLSVLVTVRAKPDEGQGNATDKADDIALEVEKKIQTDRKLGGFCEAFGPPAMRKEIVGEQERPLAVAVLTFEIFYKTALATPDVIIRQ